MVGKTALLKYDLPNYGEFEHYGEIVRVKKNIYGLKFQNLEHAQKVIESQMKRTSAKDLGRWVYITGFYMSAQYRIYKETGNQAYLQYIKDWIDDHVDENGEIDRDIWSLDNCQPGLATLYLYQETGEEKRRSVAKKDAKKTEVETETEIGYGNWKRKRKSDTETDTDTEIRYGNPIRTRFRTSKRGRHSSSQATSRSAWPP